jgi:hypothetical protein
MDGPIPARRTLPLYTGNYSTEGLMVGSLEPLLTNQRQLRIYRCFRKLGTHDRFCRRLPHTPVR